MPVFLIAVLAAYALLHYLVFVRIARGLALSRRWRIALALVLAVTASGSLLAQVIGRASWGAPAFHAGMAWLGVLAIAGALFLVESAAALPFPDRRRTIGLVTLCAIPAVAGYSLWNGTRPPVVKELTIALERLPAGLSGWTVVQVSDLHLNRHASPTRLCGIADQINRLSPDLVAITGDLIDEDVSRDDGLCGCLRSISARHGVVAVPGNHDYYAGYGGFVNTARCGGITVLRNERRLVAGVIEVAGLDEPAGRSFLQGGPDLDKALGGRDPDRPALLLVHRPDGFGRAARRGIDLQLSGHTHAGQIPPLDLLIWLLYRHSYGYYEDGGSRLYTSCGTGTWGPPMRLFSRNEIVKITLVRDSAAR